MGFWGAQGGAIVDPKRSFRWLVYFGNNVDKKKKVGLRPWYAKTAKKPSFTVGETQHQFLNHTFWYPGRVVWNDIDITLVDPAGQDDSSGALMRVLDGMGYKTPINDYSASKTITKSEAVKAIGGQVFLTQLGTDADNPLETWTLVNPWVKDVQFGDLSYEDENMVTITLTLKYDYATLDIKGQAQMPTTHAKK